MRSVARTGQANCGGGRPSQRAYAAIGLSATGLMVGAIVAVSYAGSLAVDWTTTWSACAAAAVAGTVLAMAPWRRLMASSGGRALLSGWCVVDIGAIGAVVAGTGGQRSWFWVVFALAIVFFSAVYHWRGQLVLLAATLGCYLAAVIAGGSPVSTAVTVWRTSVLVACFLLASFPATEMRRLAKRLEGRERWWRSVIEHAGDPLVVLGADGRTTLVSPAFGALLGHDPATVTGRQLWSMVHPEDLATVRAAAAEATGGEVAKVLCRLRHHDGSWRHFEVSFAAVASSGDGSVVATLFDVTERVVTELALREEATQDPLTGLANRRALRRALNAALSAGRRRHEPVALLVVDLDRFKEANDAHGHAVGDEILVAVARRLEAAVRDADLVARQGGDEFAALLTTDADPDGALAAARRICHELGCPVVVDGQPIALAASVGVACWPLHADGPADLLAAADRAMYQAKRSGTGAALAPAAPAPQPVR